MKSCSILKNSITSIAIGGFDGMHLAHQELFSKLDKNGAIIVIETGYANLTPSTNRALYSNYPLYYYNLKDIKHLNGKEFINLLLKQYQNLNTIVIGFDFKFGINASYTIKDLQELFNGNIIVVKEYKYKDIAIHSRIIRDYISNGNITIANKLLGRNYTISGKNIKGQGIGKKQFVPTINIQCSDFLVPLSGVYYTFTTINNIKYLSITFLGHRVSTDGQYAIETHIIDKEINISNQNISIEFIQKIRDNKKFNNLNELKEQIIYDISNIKNKFEGNK